jgi:phospholipid N-methyltransferase
MLKNNIIFLKQFISEFQTTGALCGSSERAAEALTEPLRNRNRALSILELGPGTGAVTRKILHYMREQDYFLTCEINPEFMRALKAGLLSNQDYLRNKDRVSFFGGPAQNLPEDRTYDVVVCCLPFLNFDVELIQGIFNKIKTVSNNGAILTYFEYTGIRQVGKFMSPRLKHINRYLTDLYRERRVCRTQVWHNLPPMTVHTLRAAA